LHLHEINPGSKIFIDANIFVYHFSEGSGFNKSCSDFLSKIETNEIHGFTSTSIIQEATHRLMMIEASAAIDIDVKNLPKYLKQHPDIVKKLTKHPDVPRKIAEFNIEIVQITLQTIEESQAAKTKYGLLSNDSLTVSMMEKLGISMLASNDLDFKRVDWLKLYLSLINN
jgi:predicted nucleic acid-binding protein